MIATITPAMAVNMLLSNHSNRAIKTAVVKKYARDMAAGDWQVNGQGISLSSGGKLLDGQHRLSAIAESGVPVEMLIIRGIPDGAQSTMDSGSGRSIGDRLKMFDGMKEATRVAAVVKIISALEYGKFEQLTYSETKNAIDEFASGLDVINEIPKVKAIRLSGYFAALAWVSHHGFSDEVRSFSDDLSEMANLSKGSPVIAFRATMDRRQYGGGQQGAEMAASLTLNALALYCEGKSAKRLVLSSMGYDYFRSIMPRTRPATAGQACMKCGIETGSERNKLCWIHAATSRSNR